MLSEYGEVIIIYSLLICKNIPVIKQIVPMVLKYFFKRLITKEGSAEVKKVSDLLGEVYREIMKFKKFKSIDETIEFSEQFFNIKSGIVKNIQELQEFILNVQKYISN